MKYGFDKMKTIRIGKSGSGVLGSIVAGQVMTLGDDAADEYINSGYAAEIGTAGDQTSRIDTQNAEIGQLKDELIECKNLLDGALGDVGELKDKDAFNSDVNIALSKQIDKFQDRIAELLNAPVVGVDLGVGDKTVIVEVDGDGSVKNVVLDGNAESDLAQRNGSPDNDVDGLQKTDEKAVEGGEVGKTPDEPDVVVAPAVVTGADGKRKKAMPTKGGKAAK